MSIDKPEVEKPKQENFFLIDRGEKEYYNTANPDDEITLPLTRIGFEALLECLCNSFHPALPLNDSMRKVLCGWIHHIGNEKHTSTIKALSAVLYKSVVNANTWTIDQEIKHKEQAFQKQMEEANKEKIRLETIENAKVKREMKRVKKLPSQGSKGSEKSAHERN